MGNTDCGRAKLPMIDLVAPHPEHDGVWLLGGGSGHGFKHGPALAELVRDLLTGVREPLERHSCGERVAGPALTFRIRDGS